MRQKTDSLRQIESKRGKELEQSEVQALRIVGSLLFVRELQCPQTRRGVFWVQLLVLFQPQSLAMEVPLLLCQLGRC